MRLLDRASLLPLLLILGGASSLGGCGSERSSDLPGSEDDHGSDSTETDDTSADDTAADDTGDSSETNMQKFDLPMETATSESGGDDEPKCDKIDFLFVVDISNSMALPIQKLKEAFPFFAESILNSVQVEDHHIMVVDSGRSEVVGTCGNGVVFSQPPLADFSFHDPECDLLLGAGNRIDFAKQSDPDEEITSCMLPEGQRYLNSSDPNFEANFECITNTGFYGTSNERPFASMVRALHHESASVCNEGFLRDDAILVVMIITDDVPDDTTCPGDAERPPTEPSEWVKALKYAKGGNEEAVTVVFFSEKTEWQVPNFLSFAELMGEHIVEGDVAKDIEHFRETFDAALEKVAESCEDFVPIG